MRLPGFQIDSLSGFALYSINSGLYSFKFMEARFQAAVSYGCIIQLVCLICLSASMLMLQKAEALKRLHLEWERATQSPQKWSPHVCCLRCQVNLLSEPGRIC